VGPRASLNDDIGQLYFLPMQGIKRWINQLLVQSLNQQQYLDSYIRGSEIKTYPSKSQQVKRIHLQRMP
jgi:hypothetical protein